MGINMTGQALWKLFMHAGAMGFAVTSCTFRYHLMLALMAVDTEQVMMFGLVCSQHAKFILVATSAKIGGDIIVIFDQGRHVGLMATQAILICHS